MTKLRLGPIAADRPVKLTIELSGSLHRELGLYAKAHAEETGLADPLPAEKLIGPMLEHFMASDRGFGRRRRN